MNGPGSYWGPPLDLGEIDPPVRDLGELGGPPVGHVTDLGEIDPPVRDFGEIAPSPDEARGMTTEQYWGPATAPPPVAPSSPPPPMGPPPSIASLRDGSAAMNAELAGAPPKPAGPTKEQTDAAAALAYYGGAGRPAKAQTRSGGGGAGGGGPRGPSPYDKANTALRGTYDEDKSALQRGASAEQTRADLLATGAADIAQRKMNDESLQQLEAADAAQHFKDYSAETQRQIDDVKSKVIEPNRAYSDTANTLVAIIGGAMGGIYQGLNHLTSNPFIDQMNKNIDREIDVQEKNLRTKKEGIGERKGLLAEMRATYKDESLAKLQARNLYYEGAKDELLARAAEYDSPAIKSRVDQAVTALSREQAKLDLNEAIRKASAAAAAAGAAERQRKADFEDRLKLQHMQNETLTANANASKAVKEGGKDEADTVARFVSTGKDKDGNPTGYLERNAEGATSAQGAREARAELRAELENALKIRAEAGTLGRTINRNDPNQAVQLYTPEWQANIRQSQAKITALTNKASKLGTIDAGTLPLLHALVGDLETRGDGADVRLRGMLGELDRSENVAAATASGARVTKYVGADGKEHVVAHGSANAPNNQKTVAREPVK
jgi:hypothetical protein